VDKLRSEGVKVGVMSIHLYRPFPAEIISDALKAYKGLVIFEKALSYGYQGTLTSDIKSALYSATWNQKSRPFVVNYILGLGGREITTPDLYNALKESCTPKGPEGDETRWIGLKFFD